MPPVITRNNSPAGELRKIGADEQRRFHHAEEDVGGGREPDRAADAERAFEQPGMPRTTAAVRANEQERRSARSSPARSAAPEGEDEIRARRLGIERHRAAADITEHEGGAGARRGGDGATASLIGAEGPLPPAAP